MAINQDHYIETCILTDRFSHDDQQVKPLLEQIDKPIDHFCGDGAYDETPVYTAVIEHSPRSNSSENDKAAHLRHRNIIEIAEKGRMQWQKDREYGQRNYSELEVQRYQRTFGDKDACTRLSSSTARGGYRQWRA